MKNNLAQLESFEADYFNSYGELLNSWFITYLENLGINNLGVYAEGATVSDSAGNKFIDCTDGYGIYNVGHNNPFIINGLINQLKKNEPFSKPFINKIQVDLARLLQKISPGDLECTSFLNSGSEAIDSAIKLVRLYKGKKKIISIKDSFYGHTMGALSISGVHNFKKNYEPLLPGIEQVNFNDINEINNLDPNDIGAIIIEPVQHDAGVKPASKNYLEQVRKLCDDKDIILIFDEVITGLGKTGYMFASDYYNVTPDILVLGKSFGGGLVPFGAMMAKKKYWQRFGLSFPMTASSYGGNLLACRAAVESINFIKNKNILSSVRQKSKIFYNGLKNIVKKFPELFFTFNGIGLLFGLQCNSKTISSEIVKTMIRNKILLYQSFGNHSIIMIEPPLVISLEQIHLIIEILDKVCTEINSKLYQHKITSPQTNE